MCLDAFAYSVLCFCYTCSLYFLPRFLSSSFLLHPPPLPFTEPPHITQPLPSDLTVYVNTTLTLSISFQSFYHDNTTVEWYWNGYFISDGIETTFSGDPLDPNGTSSLYLGQVSRASRGTYRVQVSNSLPRIPSNQRVATSSVRLSVVGETHWYTVSTLHCCV